MLALQQHPALLGLQQVIEAQFCSLQNPCEDQSPFLLQEEKGRTLIH